MFEDVVVEFGSIATDELVARLRAIEVERRRSEAELAVLVGVLDRTGAFRADGHASVRGLLRPRWCGPTLRSPT